MKTTRSITVLTLLSIAASMLFSTCVYAGRTIALRIINIEEVPVIMTITGGNCYEPYPEGLSGTIRTIQPNGNYLWKLNRVQSNDCDGKNGAFSVTFSPKPAGNRTEKINFTYDNATHLSTDPSQVNGYPGRIELASPAWYNYYTSGLIKKVKAGRAIGEWKAVCKEICNYEKIKTITTESSERQALKTDETSAISLSLTMGVEMGSFSAESNITTSYEKSVGREMETSFSSGETNTDLTRYVFTPEQMSKFNFHAIWQWVVPMTLSNGKSYVVRSKDVVCTTGHLPPVYAPGDNRGVGSCSGALAN